MRHSFYIPKTLAKRLYLGDVVLQLVVLFNVEACPFHPLVKEQQILSVSGIGVNVLLRVRETQDRRVRSSNLTTGKHQVEPLSFRVDSKPQMCLLSN